MELITLKMPTTYIKGLEKLIHHEIYPNRSEAIRNAVRDLVKKEKKFFSGLEFLNESSMNLTRILVSKNDSNFKSKINLLNKNENNR
jgi:Arc/MetJ-type ribon-helix-helix transcriptional regulator